MRYPVSSYFYFMMPEDNIKLFREKVKFCEPGPGLYLNIFNIFTMKIPRDLVKARADFHGRGWLEKIWSSHAGLVSLIVCIFGTM